MSSINKFTFITVIMTTLFAFDGMSIGYDGSKFQSATFHSNQLIYGLDFLHAKVLLDDIDFSVSINIFMPRIGYKMPQRTVGKINTYNQIEAYIVFPLVSIDVGDGDADEVEEIIEDIIDVMGFKFSKIIQYNFNDQLSLMAHVGFNLTIGNIDEDTFGEDVSARFGMTYTQLSLKFNL